MTHAESMRLARERAGMTVKELTEKVIRICEKHSGIPCTEKSSSTDCNAAASVGIPSLCVGVYLGGRAHTTEDP